MSLCLSLRFEKYLTLYKVYLKSIETEAVFTKIEINYENSCLGIQRTYSSEFSIGQSISEIPLVA